jgi:hypothetical protein
MVLANGTFAAGSSLAPAVFGLLGAVIGAVTAGGASLWVAWQTQKAAERAWMRDNRREIYDRFLTYAQQLLIASEAYYDASRRDDEAKAKVESAFTSFWEVYSVVQTVADIRLFGKARIYGYRLWELATSLGPTSVMGPGKFRDVAALVRGARHDTITEMRAELGLAGKVRRAGLGAACVEVHPLMKIRTWVRISTPSRGPLWRRSTPRLKLRDSGQGDWHSERVEHLSPRTSPFPLASGTKRAMIHEPVSSAQWSRNPHTEKRRSAVRPRP